jgi:hypothetical protein
VERSSETSRRQGMSAAQPPELATWLLRNFGCSGNNEAVIGDLAERYSKGKTPGWYWRQAIVTTIVSAFENKQFRTVSALGGILTGLLVLLASMPTAAGNSMIVHSDSGLAILFAFLVIVGVALAFALSLALVFARKFRSAARISMTALGLTIALPLLVAVAALLTPQTIVKLGDMYCEDIRCIGIDQVEKESRGTEAVYKLNVRLFSDANTVKVSFGSVSLYLQDDRGQRFPLIQDSSAVPYDVVLDPQQTIKTTLTFAASKDSKELFLTDGPRVPASAAKPASIGGKKAPFWAPLAGAWGFLASFGNDAHPLHKPTMLRVL